MTDQRMLWIRNLDGIAAARLEQLVEAEFASESQIFGALDYASGAVVVRPITFRRDREGLWKYGLQIGYPPAPIGHIEGTRKGYVFREGPVGELLSIISFHLEARIFLLSTVDRFSTTTALGLKTEYFPLRNLTGANVDPVVFSDEERNFATGLSAFLDLLRSIDARHHYPVAMSIYHYARALREIGIDPEMVFIRLVSAVEAVAENEPSPVDPLARKVLLAVTQSDHLSPNERAEVSRLLGAPKLKQRFISFLQKYSHGFFRGGRWKVPHARITRSNLPAITAAIYDARSAYLHSGDPMYLSQPWPEAKKWHMDVTVGMQWQGRRYTSKQKLPFAHFFHRLVRHSLANYFRDLAARPAAG